MSIKRNPNKYEEVSVFVENATDLRLRSFSLSADFTPCTLEACVRDSGELIFNMFDLFIMLGVLVVEDGDFDLTPLLSRGYNEESFDLLQYNSYFEFKTVVDLCLSEKNGLVLLSYLCNYLKSVNLDYFNKWYKKYLKQLKLLDDGSFYRTPGKVFLLDTDFKSKDDNLFGISGDLYVIEFSTGVIKVGRSKSGIERVRHHSNEAGRYLVTIVNSYIMYDAKISEESLIDFCRKNGELFYGNEFFKNLDFDKVKKFLTNNRRLPDEHNARLFPMTTTH